MVIETVPINPEASDGRRPDARRPALAPRASGERTRCGRCVLVHTCGWGRTLRNLAKRQETAAKVKAPAQDAPATPDDGDVAVAAPACRPPAVESYQKKLPPVPIASEFGFDPCRQ